MSLYIRLLDSEFLSHGSRFLLTISSTRYLTKFKHFDIANETEKLIHLCLDYLTFDCFDLSNSKDRLRQYVRQGSYSFQDYALQFWIKHIEERPGLNHDDRERDSNGLSKLIKNLLEMHWSSSKDLDTSQVVKNDNFRSFVSSDFYDGLMLVADFAASSTSQTVKTDPLDFTLHTERSRALIEEYHRISKDKQSRTEFESFYGSKPYKCARIQCAYFHEGYEDAARRDAHQKKHERPFGCPYTSCHFAEFGIISAKELKTHLWAFHGHTNEDPTEFPLPIRKKPLDIFQAASRGNIVELDRLLRQSAENLKLKRKGGSTILHTAAHAGQEQAVSLLLQRGAPIDAQDSKGNTPLQVAIINKDANICRLLLQWGANTNCLNARRQMAQHMALDTGCTNILEMILATGVNPDTANSKGETVLHLAMASNNDDALKMLIAKGVDLNVQNHDGKTAHHLAAQMRSKGTIQTLVDAGADLCAADLRGLTAYHIAVCKKSKDILDILLSSGQGVDIPDARGRTIIHVAVEEEAATDIIQTLLDGGADPSAIDKLGRTAYHLAAELKSCDIMRMLTPIGATLGFRDQTGRTALQIALFNGCEDIVEMLLAGVELAYLSRDEREMVFHFAVGRANFSWMQKLLDNGTAINYRGPESMTALHLAIEKGRIDVVDYLLREGAGTDLTDSKGSNSLHVAVSSHNGRMVSRLLENGVDINAKSNKFGPPLALAVVLLERYVVDMLLQSGARVDIADSAGLAPLHLVARGGNIYSHKLYSKSEKNDRRIKITRSLLDAGASPNIADGTGLRPLWYAVSYDHLEIVNALLENGLDLNLTNESSKRTILHEAVSSSATETGAIILALLEHGADPLAIDDHGITAWHAAAASGNLEVLKVLTQHMQRTKNLEIRNEQGETALFVVVKSGSLGNTQFLLRSGANPDAQNARGETPLRIAAGYRTERGRILEPDSNLEELVLVLQAFSLEYVASANRENCDGMTRLHVAAQHGRHIIIEYLLSKGALVDVISADGFTPLYMAVEAEQEDAVRALLDRNASAEFCGPHRCTPLHMAASQAQGIGIARLLIDKGARVDALDENGSSPYDIAFACHNTETARMLSEIPAPQSTYDEMGVE